MKYVALIRGLNVGGKSIVPMARLRAAFETCGMTNVSTFIASGNVLFDGPKGVKLEGRLTSALGFPVRLVLRSHKEMGAVIRNAPKGFGSRPKQFRYDVWFVFPPMTPARVVAALELRDGVDIAVAGERVVYTTRLTARASQSRLTRVVGTPIYKSLTIRSWNTARKLAELSS